LAESRDRKGPANFLESFGTRMFGFIEDLGNLFVFVLQCVRWLFRPPSEFRNIVKQMEEVGINSLPVVLVTATFTGMVLALQSWSGFQRFQATSFVGSVVALSLTRELGPVFAGLMVSGRVGASMAAELGTMKVTEQIDALVTLATNPVKYLVVPRVVASTLVLPVLVIFADLVGILGGYFVSVHLLGANPYVYGQDVPVPRVPGHLHGTGQGGGLRLPDRDHLLLQRVRRRGRRRGSREGHHEGGGRIVHDGARVGLLHDVVHVLTR
jgi:phospholipid/cholesterol/gamma-HCH transport system permease protein